MINIQKKIAELKQTLGGETLKARWKTEAQGAKDGAANYPPEDAFVISGTEQQVKADCEAQLKTGISLFRGEAFCPRWTYLS